MKVNINSIIGEIVAQDYKSATLFKKYNIDFCCNGNRSIAKALEGSGIDPQTLVEELETNNYQSANDVVASTNYKEWPLDLLTDYIEKKHHRYVRRQIKVIEPFLERIVTVHGSRHPELAKVQELFRGSAAELTAHMQKEEQVLFPFIRELVELEDQYDSNGAQNPIKESHFGSVKNPIAQMMVEHDKEGERFRQISALTGGYTVPEDGCNTYVVTFAALKEFEEDLHLHIHLENNILFPKAIELEKKFSNNG